ncbi:MAG: hypothetical protein K9N51_00140 [Candidatus Pacebacteria bacterium]|nr:hypothetical protein [Candidatus Paceibacterota bacterium]
MTLVRAQSKWLTVKVVLVACACCMNLPVQAGPPESTLRTYKRTDWLDKAREATPLRQSSAPVDSTLTPYKRTDWLEKAKESAPTEFSSSPMESTLKTRRPSTWGLERLREKADAVPKRDRSTLESRRAPRPRGRHKYLLEQYEQRIERYRKMQHAMKEAGHTHMVQYLEESIQRETEYFEKKLRRLGIEHSE